jgi:DNA-binding response OmpR family regulator
MKILAVDDDTFILELLCMVAARAGFKDVSTALSGEIALDMLRSSETPFDCLVLDISMPEMAGIELCALARAMPAYEKTPIIMLTAMAEKVFVDRAFAAGATDYANKPFDIVELSTRLRMAEELVSARRAADAMDFDAATDPTDPRKPPLSHEIRIDGIKSLIDYAALKNYLAQLSLTGIACSQVLAFKIDQIE